MPATPDTSSWVQIVVLAHNEEARIATCLESLPLGSPEMRVSVVVNGSSDDTAGVVSGFEARGVELVEYAQGGKARSWNRFVLHECPQAESYVFVDGDAELLPGTVEALVRALSSDSEANAAVALPANGGRMEQYRKEILADHDLFGDCYALSGDFVARLREAGIRLPDDLVGDDGLIRALACCDLQDESHWDKKRVVPVPEAGFLCVPNSGTPAGLKKQSARMINYSVRHFQNRIITDIMRGEGPIALPRMLIGLYPQYLPHFRPRLSPVWFVFDLAALRRMRSRLEHRYG